MTALQSACIALQIAGRRARRQRVRILSRHYSRARALGQLLPSLCDYPPAGPHFSTPGNRILPTFRTLSPRWLRDDAATTRTIMRFLVASLSMALWKRANGGDTDARIDALRVALLAEAGTLARQKARALFAPTIITEVATAD